MFNQTFNSIASESNRALPGATSTSQLNANSSNPSPDLSNRGKGASIGLEIHRSTYMHPNQRQQSMMGDPTAIMKARHSMQWVGPAQNKLTLL